MDMTAYAIMAVVVFLAVTLQSIIGFGFALFATPLLVLAGFPLPNTIVLVSTCSLLQSLIGAYRLREDVPWRQALRATLIRSLCIICGMFLLKRLVSAHTGQIRLVIGLILCGLVVLQTLCRPKPVARLHWRWGGIAFASSGLLSGLCGMGGPPLVIWLMAQDWTTKQNRGFLFAVFATAIPLQIVLMRLSFGPTILHSVLLGFMLLPLILIGSCVGLPLGNRLNKERMRHFAYALLLIIGISAVAPALW